MSYVGDKLKYFSDFDDYSATLTKKDMDDNLKTICSSVGFYLDSDGKTIKPNIDLFAKILDFGVDSVITEITKPLFVLGKENTIKNGGFVFGEKNIVDSGFVIGLYNEVSNCFFCSGMMCKGDDAYFISGTKVEASNGSFSSGFNYKNIQPYSKSFGMSNEVDSASLLVETPQNCKTTDDTQEDLPTDIMLHLKSLNYIKLYGKAFADDYSTKWIFERTLIVRIDDSGVVTIDSDDNTDIVKDDSDWAFDIEKTDDTENPKLTFKVTGKADTTISWNARCENDITYWNI